MPRIRTSLLTAGVALVALMSSAAHAEITVYTNAADFNAATVDLATDTFTDMRTSTPGWPITAPLSRTTACGYTYSISESPFATDRLWVYRVGKNPSVGVFVTQDAVEVSGINGGVSAIGGNFYNANGGNTVVPVNLVVTATDADGTVSRTLVKPTTSTFIGFVSSNGAIVSVTATSTVHKFGSYQGFATMDNLVLAKNKALATSQSSCIAGE